MFYEKCRWQPIETAPKDGTIIDLWTNKGTRVTDVLWVEEEPTFQNLSTISGWKKLERRDEHWTAYEPTQFTHWMKVERPEPIVD